MTIGQVAEYGAFFDGDWVESKDQDPSGAVRLTQLADVGEGSFRDRSDRWLREDQAANLGVSYLEEGDLLIARMPDPLGRCCMVPHLQAPAITVVDVAVLRIAAEDVDPAFVMWALNCPTIRDRMMGLSSGTTRRRISRKNLTTIEIPMPPRPEQQRIVEILEEQLSRLDAALESVRIVREKAAQFRRSLLHAAFTGALTGNAKAGDGLPSGWEFKRLDEVADVRLGRQRSPKNHAGNQMRPYLRAANVTWSGLAIDDVAEMNFTDEEMETYVLQDRDILVNEASGSPAEVGKAAVFRGEIEGCAFQNTLIRVRAHSVGVEFLHRFLTMTASTGGYLEESRGVGIFHLGKTKFAAWPVPIAPEAEQDRLVEVLDVQLTRLDAALGVAEAIEQRARALRRSLLHAAFTGKLTEQWREEHAHV